MKPFKILLTYKEREYLNLRKINSNFLGGVPVNDEILKWAKKCNKENEYVTIQQNSITNEVKLKSDD